MWQAVRSSREVGYELAGRNLASRVFRDPRDCFGEFGAPLMAGSGKPAPTPSLLGLARKLWRLGGCCIFKSRCKRGKKERDREREREKENKTRIEDVEHQTRQAEDNLVRPLCRTCGGCECRVGDSSSLG